ncbi:hypothetical protein GPA19_02295 [Azoarcus indigens]|uniref:Uncharacterized protein n=1 Tax=Azoarcus indigens TaxID=29545 RepID=A0A4R6EG39_9RHOO|nr:hypothetical protein [Azoarcus indigens]NMG63783.1 hypothetical protein [Azoarcus indigens]TDN56318.1 hypothetical protein C7389_102254 [Azoarcus indigens]
MKHRTAPMSRLAPRLAAVVLAAASAALPAWGQTSPARGPLPKSDAHADEMPLDDYLGLLQQIAPAAEAGARAYLAAFQRRCGHPMRTSELRRALSQGDGDPVLLGLIRASHLRDAAGEAQWTRQVRCPGGSTP